MNRVEKRCVATSATAHVLLLGALLFCSAFWPGTLNTTQEPALGQDKDPAIILPLPKEITETPTQPEVQRPNPPPVTRRQEVSKPPQAAQPITGAFDPRRNDLPRISTNKITRIRPATSTAPNVRSETPSADDRAQRILDQLKHWQSTSSGPSAPVRIDFTTRPGGGGGAASYSYAQEVIDTLTRTWSPQQDGVTSDGAITEVLLTIARDGTVTSARILKSSTDPVMDQSVQRALNRTPKLPAFPEGVAANELTYTIHFNLNAKLGY